MEQSIQIVSILSRCINPLPLYQSPPVVSILSRCINPFPLYQSFPFVSILSFCINPLLSGLQVVDVQPWSLNHYHYIITLIAFVVPFATFNLVSFFLSFSPLFTFLYLLIISLSLSLCIFSLFYLYFLSCF